MNLLEFVLVFLIITSGSFFQGSIGTGLGLFAAPLILLVNPQLLPAPLLLAGILLTGFMFWRERHAINPGELLSGLPGYILGNLLAILLLSQLAQKEITIISGILVILAVGLSLLNYKIHPDPRNTFLAGGLSGFMSTTTATGGPPLALLYQHEAAARVRATLSGFFTIGSAVSLISLASIGKIPPGNFVSFLLLTPGVLVGYFLSNKLIPRIQQHHLRTVLLLTSFASGVLVVLREVL